MSINVPTKMFPCTSTDTKTLPCISTDLGIPKAQQIEQKEELKIMLKWEKFFLMSS